jgi:hypothetical protein
MSARAIPPQELDQTMKLFRTKRTRSIIAPQQQGRIGWFRSYGQPATAYYWHDKAKVWRLVVPNAQKQVGPTRLLRVSPASPPSAGWEFPNGFPAVNGHCTD